MLVRIDHTPGLIKVTISSVLRGGSFLQLCQLPRSTVYIDLATLAKTESLLAFVFSAT